MKSLNIFIPLVLILIGVGCQSDNPRTVSHTSTTTQRQVTQTTMQQQVTTQPQVTQTTTLQSAAPAAPVALAPTEPKPISSREVVTDKATYTIDVLPGPSPKLTPTSREGDKASHVYSSNIIAVHVRTNSPASAGSTNVIDVPTPANNPQPPNE